MSSFRFISCFATGCPGRWGRRGGGQAFTWIFRGFTFLSLVGASSLQLIGSQMMPPALPVVSHLSVSACFCVLVWCMCCCLSHVCFYLDVNATQLSFALQLNYMWAACIGLTVSVFVCFTLLSVQPRHVDGPMWGWDRFLSSAHSLCVSLSSWASYLPHLAHGANGNQPFSGDRKAEREREKKKRDARSFVVFDGALGGV